MYWLIPGRQRTEGLKFVANPGKKVHEISSQPIQKMGEVAHTCHPSYMGSVNRRITAQASPNII
jgi:hypothetical protein